MDGGLEEVEVLLLQGGEVGADGAEGLCAFSGAEASGDLVLDLGHADRLFGKVVTELVSAASARIAS